MNHDFWLSRWASGHTGFHEGRPNRHLVEHVHRLGETSAHVFVPLCGKAVDLVWLAGCGHQVTGLDVAEQALVALFEDNGLTYERDGPALRGDRITAWTGDFFELTARDDFGPFDAVYDRAAIVAIDPIDRERYVQSLLRNLTPDGTVFLIGFSYDTSKMDGPPYCVDSAEVERLFHECTIECVADEDVLEANPKFKTHGLEALRESAYVIRRR